MSILSKYIGEKVVLICARYQYWGIVSEIDDQVLVLANTVVVESSGSAQGDAPQTIDPIGSSVDVMLGAIECLYRPKWVNNPLPGE